MIDQIQILKKLSGNERLAQAFKLSDFVRELALKNIKIIYPNLSKKQQSIKLSERLRYG
jgi:hypothetical protein